MRARPPSRVPRRGSSRRRPATSHRDDAVAPLGVRDADHLGRGDGRVLAQPRGDGGGRHVHPAADDHVVDPAEHAEPPVLVEPTGVGGQEPPVDQRRPGRPLVVEVAVEEGRAGDPDPAVRGQREADAVERQPVVHAAAAGLRGAVRRDHPHPGLRRRATAASGRPALRPRGRCGARRAPRAPRGRRASGAAASAPPRRTRPAARPRRGVRSPRTAGPVTGHQRPDHDVEPRDVRRGEREHPRPGAADAGRRGRRRRQHRVPAEDDLLRRARRPGGGEDDRPGVGGREPRLDGVDVALRVAGRPQEGHATNATGDRSTPRAPPLRRDCLNPAMATVAHWVAGARPRTLPAAVSPVLAGTAVALYDDGAVWWKARARPRGQPGPAGRRELRQRLLRRHPRHRRRPGRADAARRLGDGVARRGEARGVRGVRRGRGRRAGARRDHRLVAGRRRRRLRGGRVVLHRRLEALRLPRARRGDGVLLLRPGRGDRHGVRPDRDLDRWPRSTPPSGSAAWPARSSSPTTCATSPPTASPAR